MRRVQISMFGYTIIDIQFGVVPERDDSEWRTQTSWARIRKMIRKRDREICEYCKNPSPDGSVDHIIPLSKGGSDHPDNLTWACQSCNSSKKDRILDTEQARQELLDRKNSSDIANEIDFAAALGQLHQSGWTEEALVKALGRRKDADQFVRHHLDIYFQKSQTEGRDWPTRFQEGKNKNQGRRR